MFIFVLFKIQCSCFIFLCEMHQAALHAVETTLYLISEHIEQYCVVVFEGLYE